MNRIAEVFISQHPGKEHNAMKNRRREKERERNTLTYTETQISPHDVTLSHQT